MSMLFALILAGAAEPDRSADTATLQAASQAMIDSIAPGDTSVYQRYLDPALIHVDENNVVRDKTAFMKELGPLPPGIIGSSKVEEFRATFAGDLAFTTWRDQETVSFYGQPIHTRFRVSDTWHKTPDGWRVLGETISAELRDPPATTLSTAELCAYNGHYRLTEQIVATIRCDGDHLLVERTGRPAATYRPEVRDLFFSPGSPRSRRVFLRDANGKITGFADRREGEDARWTRID